MNPALQTIVRSMELADIRAVMDIEMLAFPQPWSALAYHCELCDNPRAWYIVAERCSDAHIVGYAGLWHQGQQAGITRIAVSEPLRRTGLGSRLLEHLLLLAVNNGARWASLELRAGNLAALAFYQRHGFEIAEVMPAFYSAPREDGLLMVRGLDR